jgi:type I restriction enzyme, S subunit
MVVQQGYKQTEIGVIPEDWDVRLIREVSNPVRGGSPRPAGDPRYFDGSFIPWLTVSALTNIPCSQLKVLGTESFLTEEGSLRSRVLFPGTLIIANSGATLGIAKILGIKCCANDGIAALLNFSSTVSTAYLVHYINTRTQYLRDVVATGNGQPNLNTDLIGSFKVPLPTLAEQEAIAGALSDADAWIESLEQLIGKKRQIKQGAMQELLTGKRRLPGFSGEWETKQISDIAWVGRGRVISHVEISKSRDPRYPVFSSQTFNDGVMGYINTFDFDGDFITWTTDGANAGTVFARSGRFNCTNVCGIIKIHLGDHRLIALALGRVAKSHVSRHLGNPKLMNDVLKKISIKTPSDPAEQTAIATVLSDMDTEIESLESKLAKAREIKQGMMQELLTGRIRLIEN